MSLFAYAVCIAGALGGNDRLSLGAAQPQGVVADPLHNILTPEPARSADSLVETIGLACHWAFHNTMYHLKWEQLHQQFGSLGVRYVRDGLDLRTSHLEDLWKRYGVRTILVTEPVLSWDKYIEAWKARRPWIAAIEGPNECNGGWLKMHATYQGKSWPGGPRLFQDDLFRYVKGDPALKDIPVIAPSTAYKGFGRELAPLRSFDYANAHSYAGGAVPSQSLDFKDSYLLLGRGAACPPLAATESGYHTCLKISRVIAAAQSGVSHAAHRKYIPRQVAEYFNAGFVWTVIYEFAAGRPKKGEQEDPEAAFGLLLPDATAKPAYFALQDLIARLSESHWDAAGEKWLRPAPQPSRALAFALEGAPESLHHTLLSRADGSFQLLLWNEVSSFDLRKGTDILHADVPVKLRLGHKAEQVTAARLGPDAPAAEKFTDVQEVPLRVPDEVLVVGIKLAEPLHPAPLDPPTGIQATPGPTFVELCWPFAAGVDAYWISLNRRNLGPATKGPDGKAHFRLAGLIPATTYPFEIAAAALDGGVSAATKVPVATVDAFPDLIVRSLKVVPSTPKEGDAIQFVAVVENCGKAAVEEGVCIGTKFSVDGKTVCWCDQLHGPLAPGQQAEVRPNNGPTGKASWILTRGCHRVTALVDDQNRIVESNESNNTLTIKISTGTGPDLVVKEVKIKQAQPGKPLICDVVVANQGSEAVEKGLRISASIFAVDGKPRQLLGYNISREGLCVGGTLTLTVSCTGPLLSGKHYLRAVVDDQHRIAEIDDTNNETDFTITIAGEP
jgi:hypothetical protein